MVTITKPARPSPLSSILEGMKKYKADVKNEVESLHDRIENKGWRGSGDEVKDTFKNIGAETIGVVELGGLRYPVSSYSAKVDDNLTRGSRLSDSSGYLSLKNQGFNSIIDLTLEGTGDARFAPRAGLNTLQANMIDNAAPTREQLMKVLDFATDPKNTPAYVHCEAGKGRTGVAVAAYRIAVDGFTAQEAIDEGKKYGLELTSQIEFLEQFGADLSAGRVLGYPKRSGVTVAPDLVPVG